MPLYFINAKQVTEQIYIVDSKTPLTEKELEEFLITNNVDIFSQEYIDPSISDVNEIDLNQYIDLFNKHYPGLDGIDIAQKCFPIMKYSEIVGSDIESINPEDDML
jgi:hypothetical protein